MIYGTVAGNLGGDAETKRVSDQTVTEISIASTRKVRGEKVTQWVRCSIWGERGAAIQGYLKKGTAVTAVGELTLREFESKGEKRASLEMRVQDIFFSSPRNEPQQPALPKQGRASWEDEKDPF